MPFIVFNENNAYDARNTQRYGTQAKADAVAREMLSQFPNARIFVAEILSEYSATVDITVNAPQPVTDPEEPSV